MQLPTSMDKAYRDLSGRDKGSALSVHEDFVLVSIREVFWCRRCPISYSEKGDIDVQIGRRREASPSMSDFRQDRKSDNPLFNKIFLLWHGPCMALCERISETSP